MGDVIKDFYKSDAPQFKGRSKEKRREMAIAAKLTAERGPQNEAATEVAMSPDELALQKRKTRIDKMITMKRQQALQKAEVKADVKEATYPSDFRNPDGSKRSVAKKKTGRPIQHDQPTSGGRRKTVDESSDLDQMKKDAEANRKSFKDRDEKRKVTRGSAAFAAAKVADDVKKAARTGPQQYKGTRTGVKRIEKPKPTHTKTGVMRVEETEDSLRDRRMERGGVAGNVDYRRPAKNAATGSKKKYDGMSALAKVKAELEKKHGKGSVM